MDYLEYKGYKGSVEYSKEDDCLFGKVVGLSNDLIAYQGDTIQELKEDFQAGIDSYLEMCALEGIKPKKPYSGKLNLRMESELHGRIAEYSKRRGIAINEFINIAIKKELDLVEF